MRKKGLLVLLILGVLLLMGCENEAGKAITPLEVHGISEVWGEGTSKEPRITFFLDSENLILETIDIDLDYVPITHGVGVSSMNGNIIYGTYTDFEDPDNPDYDITLTLFYRAPKLTVQITTKGALANKKYVVEPTSD